MTVSHVARLHGIQSSLLFKWKKQYLEGNLTAVAAGEDVVPASELAAAIKRIKELQRMRPCCQRTRNNPGKPYSGRVACATGTTDEKWFFRNLGGDFYASGLMTLCLSSSNPARPYFWRFSIFRRFT